MLGGDQTCRMGQTQDFPVGNQGSNTICDQMLDLYLTLYTVYNISYLTFNMYVCKLISLF